MQKKIKEREHCIVCVLPDTDNRVLPQTNVFSALVLLDKISHDSSIL